MHAYAYICVYDIIPTQRQNKISFLLYYFCINVCVRGKGKRCNLNENKVQSRWKGRWIYARNAKKDSKKLPRFRTKLTLSTLPFIAVGQNKCAFVCSFVYTYFYFSLLEENWRNALIIYSKCIFPVTEGERERVELREREELHRRLQRTRRKEMRK